MSAIDVAKAYVGKRETAGKNRADWIDRIVEEFHGRRGDPYCAYGVSHCFKAAGAGTEFPYTGSSQAIRRWFERKGLLSFHVQDLMGWKGALMGWTLADNPSHGHVGLVAARFTNTKGKILAIGDIEFNTDGVQGDRDGDGCYEVKRVLQRDGKFRPANPDGRLYGAARTLWFCNTSDIPGGAWWATS